MRRYTQGDLNIATIISFIVGLLVAYVIYFGNNEVHSRSQAMQVLRDNGFVMMSEGILYYNSSTEGMMNQAELEALAIINKNFQYTKISISNGNGNFTE
jgi:hypothetical protein